MILLLAFLPLAEPVEHVDRIEINRVYNDEGDLWLSQVIFWRWEPVIADWACEGWRRTDQGNLRKVPGGWRWEQGSLLVEAPEACHTHTQYDREAANRDYWPLERRRLVR